MAKSGERQQQILKFIETYTAAHGYPPTVRDICAGVGLSSTSTVHGHLTRLESKGLISKGAFKNRAISRLDGGGPKSAAVEKIPVVGLVTAGAPILAYENIEAYFPVPKGFFHGEDHFILNVRGESMIGAGIHDGDKLIVSRRDYADNGDIVVALLEEEATVKRFYKQNGRIRLQPENPAMEPIFVDSVAIIGKVCGLIRNFD